MCANRRRPRRSNTRDVGPCNASRHHAFPLLPAPSFVILLRACPPPLRRHQALRVNSCKASPSSLFYQPRCHQSWCLLSPPSSSPRPKPSQITSRPTRQVSTAFLQPFSVQLPYQHAVWPHCLAMIPEAVGFAVVAGVSPLFGLWTTVIMGFLSAAFGN